MGLDVAGEIVDRLNAAEVSAGRPPLPRVEVARKTEPIPQVTVTPPRASAAARW